NHRAEVVRRFIGQKPETYNGNTDPLVAEEWLNKFEKIFTFLEVNDEDKLTLAVYKLEGDATRWWKMTYRSRNDNQFSWFQFRLEFLNKYFPQTARNPRMIEFVQLTHRNMTVAQYQAKFEELSRFGPHLIDDEAMKTYKFKEGLRTSIKSRMSIFKITSYDEIVYRAMIVDRYL
ncbi:hypothetical protein MKX01_031023, partial [Papaver californicum]